MLKVPHLGILMFVVLGCRGGWSPTASKEAVALARITKACDKNAPAFLRADSRAEAQAVPPARLEPEADSPTARPSESQAETPVSLEAPTADVPNVRSSQISKLGRLDIPRWTFLEVEQVDPGPHPLASILSAFSITPECSKQCKSQVLMLHQEREPDFFCASALGLAHAIAPEAFLQDDVRVGEMIEFGIPWFLNSYWALLSIILVICIPTIARLLAYAVVSILGIDPKEKISVKLLVLPVMVAGFLLIAILTWWFVWVVIYLFGKVSWTAWVLLLLSLLFTVLAAVLQKDHTFARRAVVCLYFVAALLPLSTIAQFVPGTTPMPILALAGGCALILNTLRMGIQLLRTEAEKATRKNAEPTVVDTKVVEPNAKTSIRGEDGK